MGEQSHQDEGPRVESRGSNQSVARSLNDWGEAKHSRDPCGAEETKTQGAKAKQQAHRTEVEMGADQGEARGSWNNGDAVSKEVPGLAKGVEEQGIAWRLEVHTATRVITD